MATNTLEICVKGKYLTVPTVEANGKNIIIGGRWIKVAVVHDEDWLETETDDPEECIKRLRDTRSHNFNADVFTFTQKLPNVDPKYPYPMERDSLAVIRLTNFEDWWERKLPYETRKYARRALKRGVVVKVQNLDDQLIEKIVELNNASPLRQGRSFDHYGKTFEEVKMDQASFPGRSDFICAYFGEELIGFIKIVRCNEIAAMLQIITNYRFIDKRPGNALFVKTVEHCLEIGMKYLTYGKYVYGNKRTSTLIDFKRRHGFEEVLVPRYYVPLTVKGKIGISLQLHRGIVGILPGKIIDLGLNLREKWYKIKTLCLSG